MANLSYKASGVDIDVANAAKQQMAKSLETANSRVLNKHGAFATLFDGRFPEYKHPVLVFKTEEPGSKQKLAFQYNSINTICQDLIAHLINDCIVMGAKPLSVQDCIVCGKMEKKVVVKIVSSLAQACKDNGCVLAGGETSEQPGVVEAGTYISTASVVGVVEKEKIIDGSKIKKGDCVLALPSSGLHTNGFSLVRKIMKQSPKILKQRVGGQSFIKTVLTPHKCYYNCLKDLFGRSGLTGLAHITGGGIKENLDRILPADLNAQIDLSKVKILPIFKTLKKTGQLQDADMLRTFNMGVGITAVVKKTFVQQAISHLEKFKVGAYEIGEITAGEKKVIFQKQLNWGKQKNG